jgi:RNA polymerase sigma-70 factor (ECF subfamily)
MAMEAWRAYRRYDPTRSFSTWLYRVALNVGISFFRAQRRHVSRLVPIDDHRLEGLAAAPEACHDDLAAALQSFIERLNEFDRALMLLYLDDEPYAAIADILGISQSNVATKINRIKQRLRRQAADALDV